MIEPAQFLFDLAGSIESLLAKSKGLPAYKSGITYYVTPNSYVEIYLGKHFSDGVYLIKDIITAYSAIKSLLQDRYILKEYPIITRTDKYGFSILKNGKPTIYVPMVTTDNRIALFLSKKLYRNIKETTNFLETIKNANIVT